MSIERHSRRAFLGASAGLALAGCVRLPRLEGRMVGPDQALGHRMRDGGFPAPATRERQRVIIIGGGVAGLSAARRLALGGFRDFTLLELDREAGGNSRAGANEVSAYPWGAHYLPLPGPSAPEILQLLVELGAVTGFSAQGLPEYREEFLCHDPSERLFRLGRWQEGLAPETGLSRSERGEIDSFLRRMKEFKRLTGADGRPAFAIPADRSSRDPTLLALDQMTMADWLRREGYEAEPLRWYVDYCCRDDYGGGMARVSAWAGIHYFASRDGQAANAPPYAVLTWPEGNGWLTTRLQAAAAAQIRTGAAAFRIETDGRTAEVDWFDTATNRSIRTEAEAVIFAGPRFAFERMLAPAAHPIGSGALPTYAPWAVCNLTLSGPPAGRGVPLAWDNVVYGGRSLGYVVATHQDLKPFESATVLTHYQPLDHTDPASARREAAGRSWRDWAEDALADLSHAHPEIRRLTRRVDVMLWAHGMVQPTPGFLWGAERAAMLPPKGRIFFAHSDMSGLSLFEEAFVRGVAAAEAAATAIQAPLTRLHG